MAATAKSISLILIAVLFIALGQVFWKLGTNKSGVVTFSAGHIMSSMSQMINTWFILGCLMLLASSVVWVIALSMVDLSVAFPFQSLAYVFIFFFSIFIFKEPVTLLKIVGTMLIISGVITVAKS
ncbi:MAG: hypothetical protein A2452_10795 [Candidatus Firestonebacteria bacterium RIFOXYC2_FULL_39_67]|nr:MAG: hypothetical protein A2536_08695 [Candidatus Firestonebacteria bacterium RIFOXYD2_FULL_39_29]OGF55943.1 MAG: hypothetical protein A2452_10795 [Candidatus Firestonebacteria bacterium RIFOXYC2_FULL_39_67]OGF56694.1 MAG: hypothetical protein A2497_06250 [Candidatus Firestonebacteria bacterium RifOxyC12_full_39_7]